MSLSRLRPRQRGVSMIELMIALAIGTLLVLGLVEVFSASRTAYQLSQGLARVQENGRFAIDYLQRDLRMAGHMGCVNDQSRFLPENDGTRSALASTFLDEADQTANIYNPAYLADKQYLRFDQPIEAYEANGSAPGSTLNILSTPTVGAAATAWTPSLPAPLAAALTNRISGSDILVLRYFSPSGAQVSAFTPGDPTAVITIVSSTGQTQWARLSEGGTTGLFGIADCMNAAVFHATAMGTSTTRTLTVTRGASVNRSAMAGYESFVPGQAMVYQAITVVYYVGWNAATERPALYRYRYNLAPGATVPDPNGMEELVEGIETMQLRFAQDSETNPANRPTGNMGLGAEANGLTAPTGDLQTAWRRVGLVQVGLLARSAEPTATAQRNDDPGVAKLSLLGATIAPPSDGNYRDVYEESVALRNRLFGN